MISKKVSKVVKTMTVGVAAVTSATAVNAKAAEPVNEEAEQDVVASTTDAKNACDAALEENKEAGQSEKDVIDNVNNSKDVEQGVADASNELYEEAFDEGNNTADDILKDTNKDIEEADKELGNSNSSIEGAKNNTDAAEETAKNIYDDIADVNKELDKSIEKINNATSIEEANEAFAEVDNIVAEANERFAEASSKYEQAVAAYDEAVSNADKAEAAYQAAVAAAKDKVADAKANLDAVMNKTSALLSEVEAAKKSYEKAVEEAEAAVEVAKKELEEAEAAKNEAKKALDSAKAVYDSAKATKEAADSKVASAKKAKDEADERLKAAEEAIKDIQNAQDANELALEILKLEGEIQAGNSNDWNKCDKLFITIIKNYYVPEVLKAELVEADSSFTKFAGDDSKNYYRFVINKDGKEIELRYNYKLRDGKELIIFEKDYETIVTQEAQAAFWYNDTIKVELSESTFDALLKDGTIVKNGDDYLYKTGKFTTDDKKVTGDISNEESKQTIDKDGNIIVTETADLTEHKAEADLKYSILYEATFDVSNWVISESDSWNKNGKDAKKYVEKIVDKVVDEINKKFKVVESSVSNVSAVKTKDNKKKNSWNIFESDPDDEFKFKSGKVTIKFANTSTETVDYNTFEGIWDSITGLFGSKGKEGEISQEIFDTTGKEVVDFDWTDWHYDTAKIEYFTLYEATGTSEAKSSDEAASQAAKNAAVEAANKKASEEAGKLQGTIASIIKNKFSNLNTKVSITGKAEYSITGDYSKKAEASVNNIKDSDVSFSKDTKNVVTKITTFETVKLAYQAAVEEETEKVYGDTNGKYTNTPQDIALDEYNDKAFREFLGTNDLSAEDIINKFIEYNNAKKNKDSKDNAYNQALKEQKDASDALATAETTKNAAQSAFDAASKLFDDKNNALVAANNNKQQAEAKNDYADLLNLVKKAGEDVISAKNKVDALKAELDKLDVNVVDRTVLIELNAKLGAAEAQFKLAQNNFDKLKDVVDAAKTARDNKIQSINDSNADSLVTIEDAATPTGVVNPAAPVTTDTTATVGNIAPTTPANNTVTIADEEVPLGVVEDTDDNETVSTMNDDSTKLSQIEDEDVPLGIVDEVDDEDEAMKLSWWWLLIVAVLGATGYGIYKKHENKKKID